MTTNRKLKTHGVENRRRFSTPCVFGLKELRHWRT